MPLSIAMYEVEEWEENYLRTSPINQYQPTLIRDRITPKTASQSSGADVLSVFIYSDVDKAVLDQMPSLRLIATRSTGFDHIDMEECAKRGITVSNVPHYGENTVAEHAFGLILSLSRKIYKAVLRTTKLDFSLEGLRGIDLKGRTIGIIGAGRIGLHIVRIAKGFGMNVLVFDPRQDALLAEVLGFDYAPFDELLSRSDVISINAPLTKGTYHMINMDNVNLIKHGALLVNTARGAIVETEALIYALDEGIIAGAGLDVFEGEESVKEETALLVRQLPQEKMREILLSYTLLQRDNVVMTPHIAFYSEEALLRILQTTVENIEAYASGGALNVVSK